jgi:hypothetical protein
LGRLFGQLTTREIVFRKEVNSVPRLAKIDS